MLKLRESYRQPPAGYALVTTLIMMMLLFMMVLTLILSTRHSSFLTRGYHDRTVALYVAESGLARALEMLAEDPDWAPQNFTETMPSGAGQYTISFENAGNPVKRHQSVNNFGGSAAVHGARGPGTVPAGSSSVVVLARAGTAERTIEAIVSLGGGLSIEYPMINSGRLVMEGTVRINGWESLDSEERVPAGIHSNYSGRGGLPTILWNPQRPQDRADIAGRVSTVDSSSGAIEFDSSTDLSPTGPRYSVTEMESGASPQAFPSIPDISQTINSKRGAPSPSFSIGVNTLPEGDYYSSGSVEINGDLHLDGGVLYVEESLTVHGTITGQGSVFVGGETAFYGDAHLEGSNRTAVFSKGNVTLSGYSGTQYLQDLASADPTFANLHSNADSIMGWMQSRVKQASASGTLSSLLYDGSEFDSYRRALGQIDGQVPTGLQNDTLGLMIDAIMTQEESLSRNFVVGKLRTLKDFAAGGSNIEGMSSFAESPHFMVMGLDTINDNPKFNHLIIPAMNLMESVSLDQIGASYFQGVVYTNGYLYAENDVTVLGAVIARDDGSQEPDLPNDRYPGDIYLMNNTHITYIKDFFEEDEDKAQWSLGGSFRISSWIGQ